MIAEWDSVDEAGCVTRLLVRGGNLVSIGMFLSEQLWFRSVEDRLQDKASDVWSVLKRMRQRNAVNNPRLRGNVIAASQVVEALMRHGSIDDYRLLLRSSMTSTAESVVRDWSISGLEHESTSLISIESLAFDPRPISGTTVLFNPLAASSMNESPEILHRLRNLQPDPTRHSVVHLLHGLSVHRKYFDYFIRLMIEGSLPYDSFIVTSEASRKSLRNLLDSLSNQVNDKMGTMLRYDGRIDLLPLCVDTERFKPREKPILRSELGLPQKALTILYLGLLSPLKADLIPLLDVVRDLQLECSRKELMLIVAGANESDYSSTLRDYARSIGLSDKSFCIMSNISDIDKTRILPACDIFVSPADSLQESFGLTPIEAMSCGLPQLVSDWDGYRDTVEHGVTGFRAPTFWMRCHENLQDTGVVNTWMYDHLCLAGSTAIDMEAFRGYLKTLVTNDDLRARMSKNSRERAVSLFSMMRLAQSYSELWSDVQQQMENSKSITQLGPVDRPFYDDWFENYASQSLHLSTCVQITLKGKLALDGKLWNTYSGFMKNWDLFNEKLLKKLLTELSKPTTEDWLAQRDVDTSREGSLTFTDLAMRCCSEDINLQRCLQHVMWLAKRGLVKVMQ